MHGCASGISGMAVTWDRGVDVLCGAPGHQCQLRFAHCCTALCKSPPTLDQVIPVKAIPITSSSSHGLKQLRIIESQNVEVLEGT